VHELAVTQRILEIALRHADGASRITKLNLIVGDLTGILSESVQFYWDIITRETRAEGSTLCVSRVPTRLRCGDCGHEFAPDGRTFDCPNCGGRRVIIMTGREFRLESIEVQ